MANHSKSGQGQIKVKTFYLDRDESFQLRAHLLAQVAEDHLNVLIQPGDLLRRVVLDRRVVALEADEAGRERATRTGMERV